jgi:hypothetical protein
MLTGVEVLASLGGSDFRDKSKTVKDFRHYIFVINRTRDSTESLPKIETDFEKEIARIMPRTAPRRTEKSSVSADLSSYHHGALPGGSARPRNRPGSTSILGRVAVCIDGT